MASRSLLFLISDRKSETGIFPDDLKWYAYPPYIREKVKQNVATTARPMSVISVVAKVFEKLISGHLMEYLETNQLLSDSQAGVTSLLTNTS